MTETKGKPRTVWLKRHGYEADGSYIPRYLVTKSQNILNPRIDDRISEAKAQELIDDGVTVNVS